MSIYDTLTKRVISKKLEKFSSLDRLENVLVSTVSKLEAPKPPKDKAPTDLDSSSKVAPAKVAPANVVPATEPQIKPQGFNHQAAPTVTASSMVQSMGSALQHPVQINHDASGLGVTHAAMLVHPEWNQDSIKEKINNHLISQNWTLGKGTSGGKTYESPEGHKIHVSNIGKHLVVSGDDKKGSNSAPYTPPEKPVKKEVKKSELSTTELILYTFDIGVTTTLSSLDNYFNKK